MTLLRADPSRTAPGPESRRSRLLALVGRHPYLTVAVVALVVRTAVALLTFSRTGYTIPDEQQYVELARTVASGHPASDWHGDYGPNLYSSTWPFTGVLRFLFYVFGQSRLVAQLYPAVVGSAVAVLTTVLARRLVSAPFAVIAGLIVALTPSQVLWSSVALREAFVWFAAVGLAVLCALAVERRRPALVPIGLGIALAFVSLHHLRNQTLVAALWAVIAAGWFGARSRLWRGLGGTVIGVGVPLLLGMGAAGYGYVHYGTTGLAERRTLLAAGADSAVTQFHEFPTTTIANGGASAPVASTTTTTLPAGEKLVGLKGGPSYIVEETAQATFDHIPRGFGAFLVRPFPWESTDKPGITLARFENLLWFALYGLAAVGTWRSRRNPVIAFPVFFVLFVCGIAFVSQGNVGTGFRHRGQLLWALAVLAVVPLEQWWTKRSRRPAAG